MKLAVGITCYHTFGGSGIVATEIGLELARRGHRVHFICAEPPARLDPATPNLSFHKVELRDYPLLLEGQYPLALASQMLDVAVRERLDLWHVHYALPHATRQPKTIKNGVRRSIPGLCAKTPPAPSKLRAAAES